jgi:pimeloyl-ACP methyl ester carboxylesterase
LGQSFYCCHDVGSTLNLSFLQGLDWHGPSSQEAWASLDALANITHGGGSDDPWKPWRLERDTPAVLFGHSNGGQGAWWNAERYPDRVVAG